MTIPEPFVMRITSDDLVLRAFHHHLSELGGVMVGAPTITRLIDAIEAS